MTDHERQARLWELPIPLADTSARKSDREADTDDVIERRHLEFMSGFYCGALLVLFVIGISTLFR